MSNDTQTAAKEPKPKNVILDPAEPGTSPILIKGKLSRRYLTWFTIVTLATTAVWGGVLGILLPNQVQMLTFTQFFTGENADVDLQQLTLLQQQISAGAITATPSQAAQLEILRGFDAARATSLSVITSVGIILTMLIQPLVGVASDRTRSRWGRRAPWILFGTVVGGLALIGVRFAPSVVVLAVVFMIAQALINTALGPLNTTVADRMPENRRGMASALGGFGNFFGGVMGGVFAGALFATLGLDLYFVFGAFVIFAGAMFAIFARDSSSKDLAVPPFSWKKFAIGFTIAVRDRNFRWVWVARILLTFGYTVSTALGFFMLQSYVQPALSVQEATALFPLLGLAGIPFTLISLFISGKVSDKIKRRRPIVIIASFLMAAAMLIPIISPTVPGLFLQAVVAAFAFGMYLPVDQALFIDVLPDEKSAGRDLGVAALGGNLGQALGPIVAGIVVAATGAYLGVWIVAAVLVVLAAVALLPLKNVR